uniref:vascular endothelial growth factor A-A-like isoform X2 n=1 Tax=Pristiophorus japonicus TaxID=55135 RepID=UPI00398F0B2A
MLPWQLESHVGPNQPSNYPREAQQLSHQAVTWMDVYWRSVCQTRETLVAINSEYPNEVEFIFVPSCVLLTRCSGCCNDEQLQCVPTDTGTVLMQILKVKHQTTDLVEMSFTQHRRCECRPKKDVKEVPARNHSPPTCMGQPGRQESQGCRLSPLLPSVLLHAQPAGLGWHPQDQSGPSNRLREDAGKSQAKPPLTRVAAAPALTGSGTASSRTRRPASASAGCPTVSAGTKGRS